MKPTPIGGGPARWRANLLASLVGRIKRVNGSGFQNERGVETRVLVCPKGSKKFAGKRVQIAKLTGKVCGGSLQVLISWGCAAKKTPKSVGIRRGWGESGENRNTIGSGEKLTAKMLSRRERKRLIEKYAKNEFEKDEASG